MSTNYRRFALRRSVICLGAILAGADSIPALGITAGQVDTFSGASSPANLFGWTDGQNGNTANISTGGPAGAGDQFLQVSSGSFGGQAKLVVFNQNQWLGDYTAAGVSSISMDLKNFGSSTIPIRLGIREFFGSGGTPGYVSTTAFSLPADGLWHSATFALNQSSMTAINSPLPFATDIANVGDVRILSSALPALNGDTISAQIGVDNIRTNAVPEPATIGLLAVGSVVTLLSRRRRVQKLEQETCKF